MVRSAPRVRRSASEGIEREGAWTTTRIPVSVDVPIAAFAK